MSYRKYITSIDQIPELDALSDKQRQALRVVEER